jgi:CysZ protein
MPVFSMVSSGMYVLRGMSFLRAHRPLWKYAAAPVVLSMVFFSAAYVLLYRLYSYYAAPLESIQRFGIVLYYVLLAMLTALLFLIIMFLFGKIVSALSAPFNDLLSQKTEELVSGLPSPPPYSAYAVFEDAGRSLAHAFKLLALYVTMLAAALVFLLIPGIGALLYAIVGVIICALMFAFEYVGYAMDRRRFAWKDKKAFMRSRLPSVLGFGLGVVAGGYIPFVNVLLIPSAVIGGTLLFLDLNRAASPTDRQDGPQS